MGDAARDRLSDAGSIPARSTKKAVNLLKSIGSRLFYFAGFDYKLLTATISFHI